MVVILNFFIQNLNTSTCTKCIFLSFNSYSSEGEQSKTHSVLGSKVNVLLKYRRYSSPIDVTSFFSYNPDILFKPFFFFSTFNLVGKAGRRCARHPANAFCTAVRWWAAGDFVSFALCTFSTQEQTSPLCRHSVLERHFWKCCCADVSWESQVRVVYLDV